MKQSGIIGFPNYHIFEDGSVWSNYKNKILKPHINKGSGYLVIDLWDGKRRVKQYIHRLLGIAFISNPKGYPYINHIDGNKTNNLLSNIEWCSPSENTQHAYDIGLSPKQDRLESDIEYCFIRFMQGTTMLEITEVVGGVVSNLAKRLREYSSSLNILDDFEEELRRQIAVRSSIQAQHQKSEYSNPVKQIDKETGLTIKVWASQQEAARNIPNGRSGNISNVIAGRAKTAMGFLWERV